MNRRNRVRKRPLSCRGPELQVLKKKEQLSPAAACCLPTSVAGAFFLSGQGSGSSKPQRTFGRRLARWRVSLPWFHSSLLLEWIAKRTQGRASPEESQARSPLCSRPNGGFGRGTNDEGDCVLLRKFGLCEGDTLARSAIPDRKTCDIVPSSRLLQAFYGARWLARLLS